MHISIASGKGGTGKTLVSLLLSAANPNALLIDCDVEEPNLHLFLHPEQTQPPQTITVPVPAFDADKCVRCGRCADRCLYNALALVPAGPMLFEELCHSCGGCLAACRDGAVTERPREVGTLTFARAASRPATQVITGHQAIGVASGIPLIKALKAEAAQGHVDVIADCPPGTACSTVAALRGSDYCLLVTEPTPFGLNDLVLAVEVLRVMGIPHGLVINRCDIGDDGVESYAKASGIPVLMRIPFDREIAERYSRGLIAVDGSGEYAEKFWGLYEAIRNHYEADRGHQRQRRHG